MPLTQFQIVKSLSEALSWFEKEKNWGSPPAELRHLTGRIGELYVALITNGAMAPGVNQRGYDVVSKAGEKISVKTVTTASHVDFNSATLGEVDRVMILKFDWEELEIDILFDGQIEDARQLMTGQNNSIVLTKIQNRTSVTKPKPQVEHRTIEVERAVSHGEYKIARLENGGVEVRQNGQICDPAKPLLRQIAAELNLPTLNNNGNELNTRQLGYNIIAHLTKRPSN